MQNNRLAARYAKSILDLAIELNCLEEVYGDMRNLQAACAGSKELVQLLRSPIILPEKKKKVLGELLTGKINDLTFRFIILLVQKNREAVLPEIITAFIQQYREYKGIKVLKLTTATPVSNEMTQQLVAKVREQIVVKELEVQSNVNEDIIGGVVLQLDDFLIDASIRYDLNRIKQQFRRNDFSIKIK